MALRRLLAIAPLALACASAPAPRCELPPGPDGRVARVEVVLAPAGVRALGRERAERVAALVRQSARDWLEQADRLAPDGELALEVTIDSARLRSAGSTWLFAWIASPDHLAAQIAVRRGAERAGQCPVHVESALSGYAWRDPDARLERLARRLGRRAAAGL